jgi:phenylalanyl-tRNA synthetase beta chain
LESVDVFDVYEGAGVDIGKKSIALHLSFRAKDRTLSSEETDGMLSTLRSVLEKEFFATIR